MSRLPLTPELLERLAERFRALAEPARLRLLTALRAGPKTVSELGHETGLSQANTSKHLQLLHGVRFVDRRKEGLFVRYSLAGGDEVAQLCDLMCGKVAGEDAAPAVPPARE